MILSHFFDKFHSQTIDLQSLRLVMKGISQFVYLSTYDGSKRMFLKCSHSSHPHVALVPPFFGKLRRNLKTGH